MKKEGVISFSYVSMWVYDALIEWVKCESVGTSSSKYKSFRLKLK